MPSSVSVKVRFAIDLATTCSMERSFAIGTFGSISAIVRSTAGPSAWRLPLRERTITSR